MTLKDAVLGFVGYIADVIAEEREQCCRDMCELCRNGNPVLRVLRDVPRPGGWVWTHGGYNGGECDASPIRRRHHRQAVEEQQCQENLPTSS